jgi:CRP-like cAMP-binding protein
MVDITLLQGVPLFSGLGPKELKSIVEVSQIRKLAKDAVVFRQGDRGDFLCLVLSGKLKALLLGEDGREVILSHFEAGEIVGEMAVLDFEEERSATVVAAQETTLLTLSGREFMSVLKENPAMCLAVLQTVIRRLRETTSRMGSLIFLDTASRVGNFLAAIAKKQGKRLADGSVLITRPTQQEIAHYIGASRETVSRALGDLEHHGLIRMIGKKVILYRIGR